MKVVEFIEYPIAYDKTFFFEFFKIQEMIFFLLKTVMGEYLIPSFHMNC